MIDWTPGNPNDRSITGFCIRHGSARGPMSKNFYNKLKKLDLGPQETDVNGVVMILSQHEQEWDQARANPKGSEAKRVAQKKAWRHQRALKAGAMSAASPKHVSKQKRREKSPARM